MEQKGQTLLKKQDLGTESSSLGKVSMSPIRGKLENLRFQHGQNGLGALSRTVSIRGNMPSLGFRVQGLGLGLGV